MDSALIVGAGASGFLHALALRSAGVVIASVFDPDPASARNLVELVGGEPCTSFDAAVRRPATIAAICSPPVHHVAQATALADGRRLVLLEKPVALSDDELARLRVLPRIVPIVQWRAGKSARELRAAIAAGVFGAHPRIHCELRLWRDETYFAQRDARRWGCGALLSIGIHALDLVVWIAGRDVVSTLGRERYGRANLDLPTAGEVMIEFAGGASARVAITLDEVGCDDVRLAVEGHGTTAFLHTHEADPTATPLSWRGLRARRYDDPGGATGSPLLVPFIHDALVAARPLAVDDVAVAHRVAFTLGAPRDLFRRPA